MKHWWKILAVVLLIYTIIAGFLVPVPALPILHESIRNLYFHVTMWFGMMILLTVSVIYSIKYLSGSDIRHDIMAEESAKVGMLMGCLGLVTGSLWARFTWGAWWVNDAKLNGAAVTMLIYLAYMVLRNSMDEEQKSARVSAVYSIFAYALMIVFLLVLPRMTVSLHPGNGGNPAFSSYDLDKNMRLIFYPAVLGWTLLGIWMVNIRVRIHKLKRELQ